MKNRIYLAIAIAVALIIPLGLLAQADEPEKAPAKEHGMMGMHDMMKACHDHCQQTSASVDKVLTSLREAKASNDPAQMRSAIEEAEKPLGMMQQHMGMCMKMMNMMHGEGMGSMQGGMMDHGKMHGSKDAAAMAVDPVCGMKVDPKTAPSATYQEKTYYFCSAEEKARFEKDPASFLRKGRE
ncbi:MAG TPA: YHS domain-containing protein [Thermoanaerobaculia bacterium]|nr:YHS domain-containing protein [Thermoanaerobaculia bacterium]